MKKTGAFATQHEKNIAHSPQLFACTLKCHILRRTSGLGITQDSDRIEKTRGPARMIFH
jgi:hypothetical protein